MTGLCGACKQVCCGWRHTVILDDRGRVWTLGGSNKHGQLGRAAVEGSPSVPQLVSSLEGRRVVDVACGWSHSLALVEDGQGRREVWGWGRNDRGQLALGEGR